MKFFLLCLFHLLLVVQAGNRCSVYKNHYFACINDCGCGACGTRCFPAGQDGKPEEGFSCSSSAWTTNTRSLNCAVHDETIGPILTALLSTAVAATTVVLIILLLQLLHTSCSCALRRRNIDPLQVICEVLPEDT